MYFYTQAITVEEAIEEADFLCDQASKYSTSLPLVIDTEKDKYGRHAALDKGTRTKVIKAFCERVKQRGYSPMIYSNLLWLKNNINMDELAEYPVWVAQYYHTCTYDRPYYLWQYSSSGRVNGIKGDVDMNVWK